MKLVVLVTAAAALTAIPVAASAGRHRDRQQHGQDLL
jgi:hypothetical protein